MADVTSSRGALHLLEAFPEAETVVRHLVAEARTVAVAESCTGGLLGAALTAVAGASACFRGGVVAYADDVKCELLGVPEELLHSHGAVSAEVAAALATGVRRRLGAEVGVAITGVAGPGGGTPAKPVGLIWVAVVVCEARPLTRRLAGDRGREANRARAVHAALRLCLEATGGACPDDQGELG